MTVDEFVQMVNTRLSVGWPFREWRMSLHAGRGPDGRSFVHVSANMPHRDTGERDAGVQQYIYFDPFVMEHMDTAGVLYRLRKDLQAIVLHELDESLLLDGKRPFDPHAKEGT